MLQHQYGKRLSKISIKYFDIIWYQDQLQFMKL